MLHVVWFKRDLRARDHAPLAAAAEAARSDGGAVLPLYVAEPGLWAEPDMAGRHWAFIAECLEELRADLADLGQPLVVRSGDMPEVLEKLRSVRPLKGLWSHEETGNLWTFARDRRVRAWCRDVGVPWREFRQDGVVRGLASRTGWAKRWDARMAAPVVPEPRLAPLSVRPGEIPAETALAIASDPCPGRQRGGRRAGLDLLDSFLSRRGENYRREMSSPLTAETSCSRLSPHFAYGTVSLKEAAQATAARTADLADDRAPGAERFRQSLSSFEGRLHWHCHFMQKLEDAPDIERDNLHRGYDGLRENAFDRAKFDAWAAGETGIPFVDACMRSLRETGWINFRMRAMLVSVAANHLWLHWREPARHLARLFTDYEPGIHYPQMQMQSGTTGINTVRIYNPVKQAQDHDPEGRFIARWLPELAELDPKYRHAPWTAPEVALTDAGVVLGETYPLPVVEPVAAARAAKEKVYAVRRGPGFRESADAIQAKHGSRKSGIKNRGSRDGRPAAKRARRSPRDKSEAPGRQDQLPLDFGR